MNTLIQSNFIAVTNSAPAALPTASKPALPTAPLQTVAPGWQILLPMPKQSQARLRWLFYPPILITTESLLKFTLLMPGSIHLQPPLQPLFTAIVNKSDILEPSHNSPRQQLSRPRSSQRTVLRLLSRTPRQITPSTLHLMHNTLISSLTILKSGHARFLNS